MPKPRPVLAAGLAAVLIATTARPAAAQLVLPPAPETAADAADTFDERADAVLTFNGCGREAQFNEMLRQIRANNRGKQGEGLSDIILAKIYQYYKGGCRFEATVPGHVFAVLDQPPQCVLASFQDVGADTKVQYVIDRQCLRRQINEALMSYARHGQLGSSGVPCLPVVSGANPFDSDYSFTTEGEYDIDVRELIRILYLGGGASGPSPGIAGFRPLDDATIEHFWKDLLSVRGSPDQESYSPVYDCGNREEELGMPEDYADRQDWIDRALEDLGDAAEYLLKRWFLILALFLTGPLGALAHAAVPFVPAIALPPVLGFWAAEADPLPFARVPETENHLLMIESSRFLTNQAMIISLQIQGHRNLDVVQDQQGEVREWLLKRLQRIAKNDFEEYNARPYQRYSINALVNLHDLSNDASVKTAARIVLDYSTAKAAVGSDRARRYAPFRRRSEFDGFDASKPWVANFYNRVEGADHQANRLLLLAGQTQLSTPPSAPATTDGKNPLHWGPGLTDVGEAGIDSGGWGDLVNTATSSYRLSDPIMEVAVERPRSFQRIRNAGAEAYSSARSFLLSAGGVKTPYANTFYGLGADADAGVAVPTVLMPTDDGFAVKDVIRFEGAGTGVDRTSQLCLEDGFACGTNLVIADALNVCKETVASGHDTWFFINTARCVLLGRNGDDATRRNFYAAIAKRNCFWNDGICDEHGPGSYGILEVVDAPNAKSGADPAFDAFKLGRTAALNWPIGPSGTYKTSDGRVIGFDIKGATIDDLGGIRSLNGAVRPRVSNWFFLGDGDVIRSQGDGFIEIRSPLPPQKKLWLDFRDWNNPTWSKSY
jgi:hypothetical protein